MKETNQLKWAAFDSNFKLSGYDTGLKQWVTKGITAWCTLQYNWDFPEYNIR